MEAPINEIDNNGLAALKWLKMKTDYEYHLSYKEVELPLQNNNQD
ncbi:7599_t:CDS:2 [Cetraspora pellucida]|uniref:7599_t:CDS:1 n=1 Tax=Cetraspora pellucida TaxID=1433469 RepID=A0A9N9EKF2_9GLOM|nr:7599_t:CDS:2 [Cetraspora pellucida]